MNFREVALRGGDGEVAGGSEPPRRAEGASTMFTVIKDKEAPGGIKVRADGVGFLLL